MEPPRCPSRILMMVSKSRYLSSPTLYYKYFHIQKRQCNFSDHPLIHHPNPLNIFLYMLEHCFSTSLSFPPSIFLDAFQVADLSTLSPNTLAETSTFEVCVRFALTCSTFGAFPTVSCLSPHPHPEWIIHFFCLMFLPLIYSFLCSHIFHSCYILSFCLNICSSMKTSSSC